MEPTRQSILEILDNLPPEKTKALFYFAEWLNEEEELSPEEIIALARGKEQFKKGEFAFFEDLRDLRAAKKAEGKKRGIPLEKVKAQLGIA
jgi:hypothetical protein